MFFLNNSSRIRSCVIAVMFGLSLVSTTAQALTGSEVMVKMTDIERGGYFAGSVGMAAMMAGAAGQTARQDCIMDWYYKKQGVEQLVQALDRFKDRPAQPVILALINRACGK